MTKPNNVDLKRLELVYKRNLEKFEEASWRKPRML
jgi:hypothetical protein